MFLKTALDLSKSINQCPDHMCELAKDKGFTDRDVVKLKQQIEMEITQLQKIILENFPSIKLPPFQKCK